MPKSAVAMETNRELLFSIFSLICQYAWQSVYVRVRVCIPHCVVGGSWRGELSQPEHHLSSQSSSSPPHQRPATTRTYIWMTQCWQLSRSVCTVHQCKVHSTEADCGCILLELQVLQTQIILDVQAASCNIV